MNVTGADVVVCGAFEVLVCAGLRLAKVFDPNVGGVNEGNAVLLTGFDKPNEKLGGVAVVVAGFVSAGFAAIS